MKKISIGFSRPKKNNFITSIIMKIENFPFSHTYFSFQSNDFFEEIVYQSKFFNTHLVPKRIFRQENLIIGEYDFYIDDERFIKAMKEMSGHLASTYAYLQLVGMFFVRVFKMKNPFQEKGFYCSEIVGKFMNYALNTNLELRSIGLKEVYGTTRELWAKIHQD